MTWTSGGSRFLAVVAAVAVAGAAGVGAGGAVGEERRSSRTARFTGPGPHTIDVRVGHGSIHVLGDGGSDVRIESVEHFEADSTADLQTARERLVLETGEGGATVEVVVRDGGWTACDDSVGRRSAWWDRRRYAARVDLTIRVPRDVRVRACSVSGGSIRVEDTTGDFDVSHVNGRVVLERLRGAGRATTVNGDVEATFTAVPRADSRFRTVNGELTVTFPDGLAADLRMKTLHGDLLTDFDTTVVAQPVTEADRRSRGWGRRIASGRNGFSVFRVGRGGPALTFETVNGDVRVLKGAR